MSEETIIHKTNHWKVTLLPDQAYLGRSVIKLKRESEQLSDLTKEEMQDFQENVIKKLETTLKKAFNATMFNWSCLMNNAYKEENPKPQVHWHFRPRYKKTVKFEGETFTDTEFAHHYDRTRKKIVSQELLKKIAQKIREEM